MWVDGVKLETKDLIKANEKDGDRSAVKAVFHREGENDIESIVQGIWWAVTLKKSSNIYLRPLKTKKPAKETRTYGLYIHTCIHISLFVSRMRFIYPSIDNT